MWYNWVAYIREKKEKNKIGEREDIFTFKYFKNIWWNADDFFKIYLKVKLILNNMKWNYIKKIYKKTLHL